MQLVDANVLLYAVNEDASNHDDARSWLDGALAGQETVAFAWIAVLAFLRLSTQRNVFRRPLTVEEAAEVAESWLGCPTAVVVHPTERHATLLRGLLGSAGTAANLVNDAHLAALALEHGAEIISFDRDYLRFAGIRWRSPQAS